MTANRVRELLYAQPFEPFMFRLADGRDIPVRHREFVALAPNGRTAVIFQPDKGNKEGAMNIVDIKLVINLEMIRNSQKRRKQKA